MLLTGFDSVISMLFVDKGSSITRFDAAFSQSYVLNDPLSRTVIFWIPRGQQDAVDEAIALSPGKRPIIRKRYGMRFRSGK